MTTKDREETRREKLDCSPDSCNYDHTCTNHRILADLERELAALQLSTDAGQQVSDSASIAGRSAEVDSQKVESTTSVKSPAACPAAPAPSTPEIGETVKRLRAYHPVEGQEGLRFRDMLMKEAALMPTASLTEIFARARKWTVRASA